jgi:hypothetical protein
MNDPDDGLDEIDSTPVSCYVCNEVFAGRILLKRHISSHLTVGTDFEDPPSDLRINDLFDDDDSLPMPESPVLSPDRTLDQPSVHTGAADEAGAGLPRLGTRELDPYDDVPIDANIRT